MDSINNMKGYGKVGDEVVDPANRRKIRRRMIIVIVSSIVLATVILGEVAKTLIHNNSKIESNQNQNQTPSTTSNSMRSVDESIKAVCSVTQYPDSCFSSISSLESSSNVNNKADPEEIFKLSLQVSINELSKLSSLIPQKFIPKVNGPMVETALHDCQDLFEDAVDRVNASISSMKVGQMMLTASKMNDVQTWLSSAVTDQETCLDGLDETKSTELLEEMRTAMQNSTRFTSNSLAIVAKMVKILEDLHVPIHRKLLGFGVKITSSGLYCSTWN